MALSRFASDAASLLSKLDDAASVDVTYKRPSTGQEITIAAIPGQTTHETLDSDGFPVRMRSEDFLFPASALKLNGVDVVEPEIGDEIRWADAEDANVIYVQRLMPFGQQKIAWHYSDQGKQRLRVHTKRTGTE